MNYPLIKILIVFFALLPITACDTKEAQSQEEIIVVEEDGSVESPVNDNDTEHSMAGGVIVYTHEQYQLATGCTVNQELYERSLRQMLLSVVFKEEPMEDIEGLLEDSQNDDYTRRHSRDFFGPLVKLSENNSPCALEHLVTMAKSVGFPEGSDYQDIDNIKQTSEPSTVMPEPYLLMNRVDYMNATSCIVSGTTYEKYVVDFIRHLLTWSRVSSSGSYMKQFLQEVGEGRFTENKTLHPSCMTPTIKRLASEMGLLNDKGEYELNL